jgi:hypothetical protein
VTEEDQYTTRYFETLKGIASFSSVTQLTEKVFSFRLAIDNLNSNLDRDTISLAMFEQKLRQVRYSANI